MLLTAGVSPSNFSWDRVHLPLRILYAKGLGTDVVPMFLFLIMGVLIGYFGTQSARCLLNPILKSTRPERAFFKTVTVVRLAHIVVRSSQWARWQPSTQFYPLDSYPRNLSAAYTDRKHALGCYHARLWSRCKDNVGYCCLPVFDRGVQPLLHHIVVIV